MRSTRLALLPLWVWLSLAFAAVGLAFAGARLLRRVRYDDASSGWSAVWLGDVDGDGVPDLALGVGGDPSALSGDGSVRILSGSSGKSLGELSVVTNRLNEVVGSVSNLSGPGRPGIWWKSGQHDLHVSADGLGATSARFEVDRGGPPSDLGDVDGDGAPDVLISGFPRRAGQDTISAVSMRTGQPIWTLSEPDPDSDEAGPFGWTACAAGDVDGDGATDAAVVDARSRVLLVSGRNGARLRELGPRVNWVTGNLVPLGDVDGDARPELALHEGWNPFGAGYDEAQGPALSVVSCADGSVLRTFRVGRFVADVWSPGDVDGDGLREVTWSGHEGFVVARVADGVHLDVPEGGMFRHGSADYDADGVPDTLVPHNVIVPMNIDPPQDLWRQGRIEIRSGRDGSILRTFDEAVLPPHDD